MPGPTLCVLSLLFCAPGLLPCALSLLPCALSLLPCALSLSKGERACASTSSARICRPKR
jgi:hypothetical protein